LASEPATGLALWTGYCQLPEVRAGAALVGMNIWQDALGETLPPLGPLKQNWWAIAGTVVAGIAIVGALAWQGYDRFLTEAKGFQVGPERPTLREAALEWRRIYGKSRALANSLEVWSATEQGPFSLVAKTQPEGQPLGLPVTKRLLQAKLHWTASLKQLQPANQSATAGSEQLPRGALLVSLDDSATGERLFAGGSSPNEGHFQAKLGVRAYQACLPDLDQNLADGIVANPMADMQGEQFYWSIVHGQAVTVVRVGACAGEAPLLMDEQKTSDIPTGSIPLLSLGANNTPYMLFLQKDAFSLWSYDRETIEQKRQLSSNEAAFDSFQKGLGEDATMVPVRLQGKDSVSYLVRSKSGWSFEPCAAPNPDQYAAAASSPRACEGKVPDFIEMTFDKIERLLARDMMSDAKPGQDHYVVRWEGMDHCFVDLTRAPCAQKSSK
jgi:hypothetical protein